MVSIEQQRLCDELDSPSSYAELKTVIAEVTLENPASTSLFKGKYQVVLLENLLPWQKPIGHFFSTVLAICSVKPKKFSSAADDNSFDIHLSDEDEDGMPLPVVFESLVSPVGGFSSVSVIRQLKEKFNLYPLPICIGRKLLTLCNYISEEYQIPYPVVTLCHGANPKSVVIQGALKNDKSVQVIVNSLGSVSSHEQLPKLSAVKRSHLAGFVPSCTSIETSVYARYDALTCIDDSSLLPCSDVSVVLECYWNNPTELLEPVTSDCACYAKIKAVSGDGYYGASNKFKEIKLIKALYESLGSGVMEWPDTRAGENVMQRVENFLKGESTASLRRQEAQAAITDLDNFDAAVLDHRPNLDFTDKLWLILKDCSSCEELKEALTYVFEELNEILDFPYVHPKNSSFIASHIRSMKEKTVQWPELTTHLACEMLLEIGIEKLRRDYVMLFVGLELAPYDSISYFLQPEVPSPEAVICLEKLHCALELTIIGLKCLCLPKLLLSEFIRNVLKYYTAVQDIDLQHVFKFHFPAIKARFLLDQMRPTIWEISLLSSDKDFKKQTVLHYSTTPTSDHVYAPKDYHPKLMLKNASYLYMTGTLIEDSFFGS